MRKWGKCQVPQDLPMPLLVGFVEKFGANLIHERITVVKNRWVALQIVFLTIWGPH